MITGSGNKFFSTLYLDYRNCNADVWWCKDKEKFFWLLVWEDGTPYGTHMASGYASSKSEARAKLVKEMMWAEEKWPTLDYFSDTR